MFLIYCLLLCIVYRWWVWVQFPHILCNSLHHICHTLFQMYFWRTLQTFTIRNMAMWWELYLLYFRLSIGFSVASNIKYSTYTRMFLLFFFVQNAMLAKAILNYEKSIYNDVSRPSEWVSALFVVSIIRFSNFNSIMIITQEKWLHPNWNAFHPDNKLIHISLRLFTSSLCVHPSHITFNYSFTRLLQHPSFFLISHFTTFVWE